MFATPAVYLMDEAGVIAADVATGADAVLGLLDGAATTHASDTALQVRQRRL